MPIEAVDEAIKLVAAAGGATVVVDDDSLAPNGGIAALVGARDRREWYRSDRLVLAPSRHHVVERSGHRRASPASPAWQR
jgi:hypothetical protein